MHFGGHAHLRWNIGVTCDHRWCQQVRVSLLSAGGRPRGRQRGCSLILPGPCFPAGPRGRPSARSAQTGASGQDRGWSRGRPPEAGMRGSPGGTVPPSSRREPRRSGPVSEAHLPTRRCVGPAVLCLAAAALARGLQPQDRGDCCGHLCFHPPGRSCNVQHFPSLQDRRCLLGESLCLVLTCEALWKVLEKAHWLWMRSAVTRNPGL